MGIDRSGQRRLGKGRVVWGTTPEKLLAGMNVPPDFSTDASLAGKLRYTHRRTDDGLDLYFVANKVDGVVQGRCSFRAAASQPELWQPESGRIEPVAMYERLQGVTRLPIRLEPHESVFVVVRPNGKAFDPVVSLTCDGQDVFGQSPARPKIAVQKAAYSVWGDPAKTRDVTAKVQAIVDNGETRFAAWRLGEGGDPGLQLLKTLQVDYTLDGKPCRTMVLDGQTVCLGDPSDPEPTASVQPAADGNLLLEAWQAGQYEFKMASGRTLRRKVAAVPAARPIEGPWEVRFPAGSGAPRSITLDEFDAPGACTATRASSISPARQSTARLSTRRPRFWSRAVRRISTWGTWPSSRR